MKIAILDTGVEEHPRLKGRVEAGGDYVVTEEKVIASPPWYSTDVLSVASLSDRGEPSQFSVWGPWVSIAAPGEDITTLDPKGLTNANADERGALGTIQGTSFASPYVAGIVALVRERFLDLTAPPGDGPAPSSCPAEELGLAMLPVPEQKGTSSVQDNKVRADNTDLVLEWIPCRRSECSAG